ncbi:GDP-L-fucose synthase [Geothrix rubra]|uniref:GDP-L-fucose synthase n=1 Tax=Geothrix rubra TaxID=2927977 RepID=A0ABQ5Q8C5_9BACT|nr:GDP-L-fucose synthase [Geothrix rubra]GLH70671.1 GDP-L-fucose synthase [Geothrix rubra]
MERDSRIFIAGARGLVGSAVVRRLRQEGYDNLLAPTRDQLDLTRQSAVDAFFERERPDYVFLVAGKVGGIHANSTYPADFIRDNLLIQALVIDAAHRFGARKLLDLGSSCIYPRLAPQPMTEDCLLTSALEPTNEWYAIAKIAGLKMCQAFHRQYGFRAISLMPTNLYGPGDNFDLKNSHVLPAMLRKFHDAKASGASEVVLWGTGSPRREFLYVDDLADACLFAMQTYEGEQLLNVGTGEDLAIRELAERVAEVTGFTGRITWDSSMPDGTPRKLLDVSRIHALGWKAKTDLPDGIRLTYQWFLENKTNISSNIVS